MCQAGFLHKSTQTIPYQHPFIFCCFMEKDFVKFVEDFDDINLKDHETLNTEMILTVEDFMVSMYARQMAIVDLLIKKEILTTEEIIENTKNIKNNEPFKSMFEEFTIKKQTILEMINMEDK